MRLLGVGGAVCVITPMRRRHLRRVMRIEAVTYERHWTRSVFESELDQVGRGGRHYVVARSDGDIVGYAGLWVVAGGSVPTEAHITNIVVDEANRRRGVASALMCHLGRVARAEGATAWTLEVRATATGAHELYRRFGFAPAGVRRGYYENGTDAVVMWCHELGDDDYGHRLDALDPNRGGR